jgi:hypothetical protein
VFKPGYARYYVAGGNFPVGLSSLRLLALYFLSQARHLGGLHRAAPVPFRGSYFTLGLHPPSATPQGLTSYWYRGWDFPSIPSPRFVAHKAEFLMQVAKQIAIAAKSRNRENDWRERLHLEDPVLQ